MINGIEEDNLTLRNLVDNQLETIPKERVEHPVGYRNRYNKIHFTDKIILPIDKWINSITNVNQDYINSKKMYQKGNIKKGDVVKYDNNWNIVVKIEGESVMIQNLENINDKQIKSVSKGSVSHPEGYYHKYKKFRYTDNLIIEKSYWINRLNAYSITTEDIEDKEEDIIEYPATNGQPITRVIRSGTEEKMKRKTDTEKTKRKTDTEKKKEKEGFEYDTYNSNYENLVNELEQNKGNRKKIKEIIGKLISLVEDGQRSKNKMINELAINKITPFIQQTYEEFKKK
jgi:hypothetical protein